MNRRTFFFPRVKVRVRVGCVCVSCIGRMEGFEGTRKHFPFPAGFIILFIFWIRFHFLLAHDYFLLSNSALLRPASRVAHEVVMLSLRQSVSPSLGLSGMKRMPPGRWAHSTRPTRSDVAFWCPLGFSVLAASTPRPPWPPGPSARRPDPPRRRPPFQGHAEEEG